MSTLLPNYTDKLTAVVEAANENIVVVMPTGAPVEMLWLERVGELVQA